MSYGLTDQGGLATVSLTKTREREEREPGRRAENSPGGWNTAIF